VIVRLINLVKPRRFWTRRFHARTKEDQMTYDEQIERNKLAAARSWLADPPPPPPSPQPHDRTDKWRRMYGQVPPEN
jgi:hypothetical protein